MLKHFIRGVNVREDTRKFEGTSIFLFLIFINSCSHIFHVVSKITEYTNIKDIDIVRDTKNFGNKKYTQ